MKESLFAGIDVSTQGCKIVIIDPADERIAHVDSLNYDSDLPRYSTRNGVLQGLGIGCSESDPHMWIDALHHLFQNLHSLEFPIEHIACISISGQQHGLVALDAEGKLARERSKLWNDFSTMEECRLLTKAVGGQKNMIREVGNSQKTGYTASKIFHMVRHEPDIYERSTVLFLVHNYINWFLTGGTAVMEPGDTSGMALWNPRTGDWSRKLLDTIAPDLMGKLPKVLPADRTIGAVSDELVKKYGFSPQCLIDAGCGDNMYSAIGTGNIHPGILTISLGTSGTISTILEKPYIDPEGEIASYCDSTGRFMPLLCVSNLANGYNQVLDSFELTHDRFTSMIRRTPAGNHGRILIPWYTGERTPDLPLAAPVYFGFQPADFTPENLCRAVLEGHVLNLYEGFRRMSLQPEEIRLTGGLARSEAWVQMIADVFGVETVPMEGEGAALGASLHAAWVWNREQGRDASLSDFVSSFVKLEEKRRKNPISKDARVFGALKRLFQALSERIRGKSGEDPFILRRALIEAAKAAAPSDPL